MTIKNQSSKSLKQETPMHQTLGLVGIAPKAGAVQTKSFAQKQDAAKLAEFVKTLAVQVPDIKSLLSNMRVAAALGLTLPKGLRIYKREDGDYGVISSKASLTDKAKFEKSCSFRKRYTIVSEDEAFAQFAVHDFEQQDKDEKWVKPSWVTSPELRRENAISWALRSASCADEVASFGA